MIVLPTSFLGRRLLPVGLALSIFATPGFGGARNFCDALGTPPEALERCVAIVKWLSRKSQQAALAPAAAAAADVGTILATNEDATLEGGEPTLGGKMKATLWYHFTPKTSGRVVIDTFGSSIFGTDFDTVLAVYKGADMAHLTLAASNDDRAVPGYQNKRSLVAFNAVAGTTYHIQVGGKANAQGDVQLNLAHFPPGGGLSARLQQLNGYAFNNGDYFCPLGSGGVSNCPNPTFVLHNSSSKTLTVSAFSTFGAGIVPPPSFTLAPGAVTTKTFTFSTFDTVSVRTMIGDFTFEGTDGADFNTSASHHGVITVKAASQPAAFTFTAKPQLSASVLNADNVFRVRMTNTSATAAVGCHFRGSDQGQFHVRYQRVNGSSGAAIGHPDQPFRLAAGAAAAFDVHATSGSDHAADPRFNGSIVSDCANAPPPAQDLRNRFDITTTEDLTPAAITAANIAPKPDLLNVPSGGQAVYRFTAVNSGPTTDLTVNALYLRPLGEDDASLLFGAKICRAAASTSPCLAPAADSVTYTATQGAVNYFRMIVTPPATDPGFDAGQRRAYAYFKQTRADGFGSVLVGVSSIAVKRN